MKSEVLMFGLTGRMYRSFQSILAVMMICMLFALGCTPAQKQTTLQVVTAISVYTPGLVDAADTVAAMLKAIAPSDVAAIVNAGDTAFDTAAQLIESLTTAYLTNPSATTLQQLQTAVNTLESKISTATLNAAGIKNAQSQQLALAALKGLLTVVTLIFGLLSQTETTAQLRELRETNTVHLARLRRYMDPAMLADAADRRGVNVDVMFTVATTDGF